jgi:ABC-type transport system involved in multi-copper enzyme maturation permease subunit
MTRELNLPVIRLLVQKDWQLFQKQLAAYVLAGIVALCFLGTGKPWTFYLGTLLLIVALVATACFAISTSLLTERKEQTLAFVMSLPVSPLDFTVAKLAGNLLTFGVPYLLISLGTIGVILFTPLPDGLLVLSILVLGHIFLAYSVSLAVAMNVESEGWNTFVMIASMVLINPFIMLLGQIDAINDPVRGDVVVWSVQAVAILLAQILLSVLAVGLTAWWNGRKPAFY